MPDRPTPPARAVAPPPAQDTARIARLLAPVVALLTGCASLPGARIEAVDGRQIEYVIERRDTPAVVFENGLGGRLDWWAKVFPAIAQTHTAFAYNRPGYGRSDPPTTPRDGDHVVAELRTLLRSAGLSPPYVLVGHSLGGLYVQLFARRHPDEVRALVLVDSTHPDQFRGQGAWDRWPAWFRVGLGVTLTAAAKAELEAIDATGQAVSSLPTFTGKPVIVLSASRPLADRGTLADDANAKRRELARLYPGSTQVWVDSGHGIPLDQPQAVIDAIREVLRAP